MVLFLAIIVSCRDTTSIHYYKSPVEPKDALLTFELADGFKIELLAAEPLIASPVDMEIDEFGRLYVVEMPGYPLDKTGTGAIKLLSDTSGDGQMDKSVVYAGSLTLPTSIMRWKKGVLVTDAPNLIYFEDTNGDGQADLRDTLLTGFALSNPQHNLNSPVYHLDNWIYLAHEGTVNTQTYQNEFGDEGTEIYYPAKTDSPRLAKNASGRSVRLRPDRFLLEETSSKTQFGHSFDRWGRHILVSNANHIFQEVIPARYVQRNPSLLVSDATQSLSNHGNAAEVFPITKDPRHQLLTDVGVITSACGILSYQGGSFPSPYDNACFVAEPVSNLVHVDRLTENGASFIAHRIDSTREFLASTDAWFRPVNMYTGPDGALYVVDYYRQIIEHPEWMGEEVVKSGELYNGHDRGRIYRITSNNANASSWTKEIKLGEASSEELVRHLSNANGWWRLNAQRMLVDRNDKTMRPLLEKLMREGDSLGRLHAMWTLEGLDELTPELITHALSDPIAGLRENAIQLSERFLHVNDVREALLKRENDPDAKVRFQLLCTLGSANDPRALQVIIKLLFKDLKDPWVQVAALSGSSLRPSLLLNVVIDSFRNENDSHASLVRRLSTMVASEKSVDPIHALIQQATSKQDKEWPAAALEGLAQGLRSREKFVASTREQGALVNTFFEHPSSSIRTAALSLLRAVELPDEPAKGAAIGKALAIATDRTQPEKNRVESIQFLSLDDVSTHLDTLQRLIVPNQPSSVQIASIRVLRTMKGSEVAQHLLQKWAALSPIVQDEALNVFLTDTVRMKILLNAIEKGVIQPGAVGWSRSVRLMAQSNLRLRDKARKLLSQTQDERLTVTKEYQQALKLPGDRARGRDVYMKNCGTCHQVRGTSGNNFGPDLGSIHNWSKDAIMVNILAPNLSISSGYEMWEVQSTAGDAFQGIISSETQAAITFRNAAMEQRTINRTEIASLKVINISAMPAGFEKQINQQQMADLLAFLTSRMYAN